MGPSLTGSGFYFWKKKTEEKKKLPSGKLIAKVNACLCMICLLESVTSINTEEIRTDGKKLKMTALTKKKF